MSSQSGLIHLFVIPYHKTASYRIFMYFQIGFFVKSWADKFT